MRSQTELETHCLIADNECVMCQSYDNKDFFAVDSIYLSLATTSFKLKVENSILGPSLAS